MRHLSPRFPLLLTAHLLFAQFTPLVAQTAAPSGTPAVRLEQLDNTFFATLRKFQGPIIQEYLNELDKLKQTLLEKNKGIDAELVQAEIDRVKKTSPGMGLLPYDVLSAPAKERRAEEAPLRKLEGRFSPPSKPAPPPAIDNAPNPPSIFLIAGKEARSSLDRAVPKEKPDVKSLPLGMAEWQLENLPAGGYYVSIFYSCSE
ncbi:MAG: hypothetical protein WCN98_14660, partial [Verrucomicrobiaceae bacterium]